MKLALAALGLALIGSTTGCIGFAAVSSAPPARDAVLIDDGSDSVIRVSKGVALAIECRDVWLGGPCKEASARAGDPAVAKVMPGHLDKYQDAFHWTGDAQAPQRTVFVVAGVETGETTLTIATKGKERVFHVTVER